MTVALKRNLRPSRPPMTISGRPLKIAYSVWDKGGLTIGEMDLPKGTFGVTLIDGGLEISYDSDLHSVEFTENGKRVDNFDHIEIRNDY